MSQVSWFARRQLSRARFIFSNLILYSRRTSTTLTEFDLLADIDTFWPLLTLLTLLTGDLVVERDCEERYPPNWRVTVRQHPLQDSILERCRTLLPLLTLLTLLVPVPRIRSCFWPCSELAHRASERQQPLIPVPGVYQRCRTGRTRTRPVRATFCTLIPYSRAEMTTLSDSAVLADIDTFWPII